MPNNIGGYMFKHALKLLSLACVSASISLGGEAQWISVDGENIENANTWAAFRKDFTIKEPPSSAKAKIAVDSKYWLWINGKLAVFEGALKRGPNPTDGYIDEVDIAPFLKEGENKIAVLVWYFGKDGFSHKSSGKLGLYFDLKGGDLELKSDSSWLSRIHPAYGESGSPAPNYRLPESNIQFDARKDIENWQSNDNPKDMGFKPSREFGSMGVAPWNAHHKRPIPQWKLFDIRNAEFERVPCSNKMALIKARLPYNMQMTPIITLTDPVGGNFIRIETDHSFAANEINLRAEYITKKGSQKYESLGWLNGQYILLKIPAHVKVDKVEYRESGFDTSPDGKFSCDDDFYMRFWKKGINTLYINMRDTYYDCPERERAQWWGDAVVLMGQSFYTYSTSVHSLMRKGILELAAWQHGDGVLSAPIPGMYKAELPGQMLASIGKYGFWNYYVNTGDIETIKTVYPAVKRYLGVWELDPSGLTAMRKGGWTWGDWGDNKDMRLIFAGWHYMALEAAANMAELLGKSDDAGDFKQKMQKVKEGYNKCWNGFAYRHPEYHGETDDRVQALAVISGIADKSKYDAIFKVFQTQSHASPYMEKYVMEALFKMGRGEYALMRAKHRYANMVNDKFHTTLYEQWKLGGVENGSTNHAWSGGPITVIAQYLCGLYPLEPAWKVFSIEPDPASFKRASIEIPSVSGVIKSAFVRDGKKFAMNIEVPRGTEAVLYMPTFTSSLKLKINGSENISAFDEKKYKHSSKRSLRLPSGKYEIVAE